MNCIFFLNVILTLSNLDSRIDHQTQKITMKNRCQLSESILLLMFIKLENESRLHFSVGDHPYITSVYFWTFSHPPIYTVYEHQQKRPFPNWVFWLMVPRKEHTVWNTKGLILGFSYCQFLDTSSSLIIHAEFIFNNLTIKKIQIWHLWCSRLYVV